MWQHYYSPLLKLPKPHAQACHVHGPDLQPLQIAQLDFGKASVEGYKPYGGGPNLDASALLLSCEQAGIVTGAGHFFNQEEQRQRGVMYTCFSTLGKRFL